MNIKDADIFIVNSVNMSRLVFLRLEEHLNDNPIKSTNFRHSYKSYHILDAETLANVANNHNKTNTYKHDLGRDMVC